MSVNLGSQFQAYYNWAIAISDRAKMRGRTKEAEELWKQVRPSNHDFLPYYMFYNGCPSTINNL